MAPWHTYYPKRHRGIWLANHLDCSLLLMHSLKIFSNLYQHDIAQIPSLMLAVTADYWSFHIAITTRSHKINENRCSFETVNKGYNFARETKTFCTRHVIVWLTYLFNHYFQLWYCVSFADGSSLIFKRKENAMVILLSKHLWGHPRLSQFHFESPEVALILLE